MSEIKDNSIISRHNDIVFNMLDDEIVMMSIKNAEYYGLDSIGSRIWEIIEKPVSFKQLLNILVTEYDVNEEQCKTDVTVFLIALEKKNIIKIDS